MTDINDIEFMLLKKHLLEVCGIDVPHEKQYLFSTRLSNLLRELGFNNFSQLYRYLKDHDDAATRRRLVEAMTTHETSFFRDGHPFRTVQQEIIPVLADLRKRESSYLPPRLRLLSVGTSTGEEAYSLAICAREWLALQDVYGPGSVEVLGVDISTSALNIARRGWYANNRIAGKLPDGIQERYFEGTRDGFRVKASLRSMVSFAELNLIDPIEHLGVFDVILCRNVIIYFAVDLKRRVIQQLHDMLKPSGVLLLGSSETLFQLSERFDSRVCGATTFYIRKGLEHGHDPWS